MKNFFKKHESLMKEILRFLIVGGIATVIDFAIFELCRYFLFVNMKEMINIALSTACGFLFGNIVNYILSISYVFKGAKENKKTQTASAFILFTLIGVVGLLIKIGCQTGGTYLMNLVISTNSNFWNWCIDTSIYCFATLVVLIWNYVCRKLMIFKN